MARDGPWVDEGEDGSAIEPTFRGLALGRARQVPVLQEGLERHSHERHQNEQYEHDEADDLR